MPDIGQFIPIIGMVTGLLMVSAIGFTVVKVLQGPVGQAWSRRIHRGSGTGGEVGPEEIAVLHEQVERLEQRVAEQEERLDFAERLLADGRQAPHPEVRG